MGQVKADMYRVAHSCLCVARGFNGQQLAIGEPNVQDRFVAQVFGKGHETGGLRQKVALAFPGMEENQPRLLAMGVDALRLLPWLYNRQTDLHLAGATGSLGMTPDGVINRQLQWARFRRGEPRISKPKVLHPTPKVTEQP